MIHKLALLMVATALLVRADDTVDQLTSAGIKEFGAAYQAWDGGRFGTAAELFRQACTKAPDSSVNFYWQGAARFHRLLQLRGQPESEANTKAAAAAMEGAVAALETAVKLDAQHAESHALLGTLYGMKINGSMLRAVRYGPSVAKHQKQALRFGAENPRVRYLLGTGLFHTAGDEASRREALTTLLAAEKLFAAEAKRPAKPFEPRWGQSSCCTFIGRTYEMLGQRPAAAEYFRKALAEQPSDHIALAGLARVMAGK
jgi:tetratricopeptide (TPR) repeat protein